MIYYIAILTTGICSLTYQVIWQRYLTIILGSEARSSTIIVAIFLLGLAIGYYFFGKLTTYFKSRKALLKLYGWIEVITGIYAVLYSSFFWTVAESNFAQSTLYGAEIFTGFILLILPTILMGATVPIMTTVLPTTYNDISTKHAKIYGVNTVGGFAGVLLSSFILIPYYGLSFSLTIVGIINFFAGLIYVGNNLNSNIFNSNETNLIKTPIPLPVLKSWSFISGAVVIALELLWLRVLSLSIGSSFLVFPFIISIFILGLGYGSLTSKIQTLSHFKNEVLKSLTFAFLAFLVIPSLPLLLSNVRVSLTTIEPNFIIFYSLIYLIFCVLILPFAIPMGRVLPATFSFLPKIGSSFGKDCGQLYFINTVGTFFGATILAYTLYYYLNLDHIFKLTLLLYSFILISILYYTQKKHISAFTGILFIIILTFSPFNRYYHSISTFRETSYNKDHHWNLSRLITTRSRENLLFLEDGPDSTAAVMEYNKGSRNHSKSIFVNGKSDSSTYGDYGTLTLSAIIPYLYQPNKEAGKLKTSIIGIGTGLTAATLDQIASPKELHLVEISSSVINALEYFDDINKNLSTSPSLKIHHSDAFRFFRNLQTKHDIIISEPTNPWTVGVENLYTEYFYRLISNRLSDDGIFYQWFNLYASNNQILASVINNMSMFFPHINLYMTLQGDIGLVASHKPLRLTLPESNSNIDKILQNQDLNFESLQLLKRYNQQEIKAISLTNESFFHDVDFPQINHRSLKPFFLNQSAVLPPLLSPYLSRNLPNRNEHTRYQILKGLNNQRDRLVKNCENPTLNSHPSIYCAIIHRYVNYFHTFKNSQSTRELLSAYAFLRKERFLPQDMTFLTKILNKREELSESEIIQLAEEFIKEGKSEYASQIIIELKQTNERVALALQQKIDQRQKMLRKIGEYLRH